MEPFQTERFHFLKCKQGLNVYAKAVMREALDNSDRTIKIGGWIMNNLRYADDIVSIAESVQELQELVNRVVSKSEKAGLFKRK